MRDTYFNGISSQSKESAIRPNRSCANLALSFGTGDFRFGHCNNRCTCIETGVKTQYLIIVVDLINISYVTALFC